MANAKGKNKSKYFKKDYKKKFIEINILQSEDFHQRSKYEKLNKTFTKINTYEEDTVNLASSSDTNSKSSSSSESNNSSPRTEKCKP